jgi:type II secretory ATPase GspE/PulE/Tfp pilus assembly ATPase PilB-like protein
MQSLRRDGLEKVGRGITTIDEVDRVSDRNDA